MSKAEADCHAILIRVYGENTDVLVDRESMYTPRTSPLLSRTNAIGTGEFSCHRLLQQYALAPPIFGRFENGYAYGFVPGIVCSPMDLGRDRVWRGVARKMAEWHASLPVDLSGSQSVRTLSKGCIYFRVVLTAEQSNRILSQIFGLCCKNGLWPCRQRPKQMRLGGKHC